MSEARSGGDALFVLLGAIMVLAMHGGFAFLELGTVRQKTQVNGPLGVLVAVGAGSDVMHRSARSSPAASPARSSWFSSP